MNRMVAAPQAEDMAPTKSVGCVVWVWEGWPGEWGKYLYPDMLHAPVLGKAQEPGDNTLSNGSFFISHVLPRKMKQNAEAEPS